MNFLSNISLRKTILYTALSYLQIGSHILNQFVVTYVKNFLSDEYLFRYGQHLTLLFSQGSKIYFSACKNELFEVDLLNHAELIFETLIHI